MDLIVLLLVLIFVNLVISSINAYCIVTLFQARKVQSADMTDEKEYKEQKKREEQVNRIFDYTPYKR